MAKMVGKMMELFFNSNQKVSISYNRLSPSRRCGAVAGGPHNCFPHEGPHINYVTVFCSSFFSG